MSIRVDCGEYQLLKSHRHLQTFEPLKFYDESQFDGWNWTLEHLMIANDSWHDFPQTQLSIESLSCLRTISIGSNCFENVTVFRLCSLPLLKSVVIGEGSFTPAYWKNGDLNHDEDEDEEDSLFGCSNCPNLSSLVISSKAFVLYSSLNLSSGTNQIK